MLPNINNKWHDHHEIELICFHKGSGIQFVGDNIKRFTEGDIVLVGKDLPHYWRYDEQCHNDIESDSPYSTVIHFDEHFIGERFLDLPEALPIRYILDKAKRGLLIQGENAVGITERIDKIYRSEGLFRITSLLECIAAIAALPQGEVSLLSSIGFKYDFKASENDRMNKIYDFCLTNFKKKIHLDEVAEVADLVPHSFCRYFKNRTGKTFSQVLIDIRIGHACKLILEDKLNIKQICFECGFNNLSCFHKNFKNITGKTPALYKDIHQLY